MIPENNERYTRKQFTETAQLSTSHYSTKYIHFEITCYSNHQIDHQKNNLNTSYTKFCSQLHLFPLPSNFNIELHTKTTNQTSDFSC